MRPHRISFNEAQFESYRHLGSWMISSYFEKGCNELSPSPAGCDMATFFSYVETVDKGGNSARMRSAASVASANATTLPAGEI